MGKLQMHLSVRIMRLFSFSCIDANWAERMSSECKAFKQKPLLTQSKALIQNKLRCHPQQLESFCVFAIKSAYAIKKHRNPLEFHKASAPEPSGTSQGICTGTLRNLTRYLHRNLPEPHKVSAPEPPEPHRTLRSLSRYLHRNPPEPHEVSVPEPSGSSRGIWS